MTPIQFAALAKLLQSRHGPAERAARLVLVDGVRNAGAARGADVTPAQAFNAVTRYRRAYALALIVAGRAPSVEITTPPVRGNTAQTDQSEEISDLPVRGNSEWAGIEPSVS